MGGPEPIENLRDFNSLLENVQELEKQLSAKEEQQAFLAQVIAEKQRLCQKAKEQHEERIRTMARQARKQRGRRSASLGRLAGAGVGTGGTYDSQVSESLQEVDEEEEDDEDEDGMRDMQSTGTQPLGTSLDMDLLREALGTTNASRLLGEIGSSGEGDADAAAGGLSLNERLPTIRKALEERLGLLQGLNKKVAEVASKMEAQGSDVAPVELDQLSRDIASALGTA
mmetsp:Transcript_59501/g.171820  ORF Transcript_59501/g.171820 Transcript_59501/m.171820 type:complete len:227 (+) Transcript_59501:98-778(+)